MIDWILFIFAALLLTYTITDVCYYCCFRKGYGQLFSSIAVCVMLFIFMDTEPHVFMYVVASFFTSQISSGYYLTMLRKGLEKATISNEIKR